MCVCVLSRWQTRPAADDDEHDDRHNDSDELVCRRQFATRCAATQCARAPQSRRQVLSCGGVRVVVVVVVAH